MKFMLVLFDEGWGRKEMRGESLEFTVTHYSFPSSPTRHLVHYSFDFLKDEQNFLKEFWGFFALGLLHKIFREFKPTSTQYQYFPVACKLSQDY